MIVGTVTGGEEVAARFKDMGTKVRESIVNAMQRQWFKLQAATVTGKLSGDPLHRRTGVLASSINVGGADTATAFTEEPMQIIGRVGTRVRYGRVHEEGGTFTIPAHARNVQARVGGQMTEISTLVRAHTATFPQRSFLRSTLDELHDSIREDLKMAVLRALKEK